MSNMIYQQHFQIMKLTITSCYVPLIWRILILTVYYWIWVGEGAHLYRFYPDLPCDHNLKINSERNTTSPTKNTRRFLRQYELEAETTEPQAKRTKFENLTRFSGECFNCGKNRWQEKPLFLKRDFQEFLNKAKTLQLLNAATFSTVFFKENMLL